MSAIDYSKLSSEVQKALESYQEDIQEIVTEEAKKAAQGAITELKETSPKLTGAYSKDWKSKTEAGRRSTKTTVYNAKHYRLTHLLEFGHAKRGGGRTGGTVPAYPHIEKANENAAKAFEEGIVKRL